MDAVVGAATAAGRASGDLRSTTTAVCASLAASLASGERRSPLRARSAAARASGNLWPAAITACALIPASTASGERRSPVPAPALVTSAPARSVSAPRVVPILVRVRALIEPSFHDGRTRRPRLTASEERELAVAEGRRNRLPLEATRTTQLTEQVDPTRVIHACQHCGNRTPPLALRCMCRATLGGISARVKISCFPMRRYVATYLARGDLCDTTH